MKLQRDNDIVVIENENIISAFKEAGYVEVEEKPIKKTSPELKKTTKTKA